MTSNSRLLRLAHTGCSLATLAVALGWPTVARAQGVDEFGSYTPPEMRQAANSSQNFALELRFGPYLPRVDSEFSNGETPFRDYFGTTNRLSFGIEFDWLPLEIKNTLRFGPGIGLMYTTMSAGAFIANSGEGNDRTTKTRAGQDTSLRVLPHWAAAVLRIDALARRTWIPIVLVGKVGIADALWWVKDEPTTRRSRVGDVSGRGRSYGAYYGAGVHLDFSFLDDQRRKRLDSFLGINRIYFFGEMYALELDGFGSEGVMNVGDRSWVLGMAFDL